MDLKGSSEAAIKEVTKGQKDSACYMVQMTKALFRDSKPEEALRFFEQQMEKRAKKVATREEALVKMYDAQFKSTEVSFDEFKAKHLEAKLAQLRAEKEAFAVGLFSKVIADKDFRQIEDLLSLHAVMREEKAVLGSKYETDHHGNVLTQSLRGIDKEQRDHLYELDARKRQLTSNLTRSDLERLHNLQKLLQDNEVDLAGTQSGE